MTSPRSLWGVPWPGQDGGGVPPPGQDGGGGYPGLIRTGGGGYSPGQGLGIPPPGQQREYLIHGGGMPLAFTREDFLVWILIKS